MSERRKPTTRSSASEDDRDETSYSATSEKRKYSARSALAEDKEETKRSTSTSAEDHKASQQKFDEANTSPSDSYTTKSSKKKENGTEESNEAKAATQLLDSITVMDSELKTTARGIIAVHSKAVELVANSNNIVNAVADIKNSTDDINSRVIVLSSLQSTQQKELIERVESTNVQVQSLLKEVVTNVYRLQTDTRDIKDGLGDVKQLIAQSSSTKQTPPVSNEVIDLQTNVRDLRVQVEAIISSQTSLILYHLHKSLKKSVNSVQENTKRLATTAFEAHMSIFVLQLTQRLIKYVPTLKAEGLIFLAEFDDKFAADVETLITSEPKRGFIRGVSDRDVASLFSSIMSIAKYFPEDKPTPQVHSWQSQPVQAPSHPHANGNGVSNTAVIPNYSPSNGNSTTYSSNSNVSRDTFNPRETFVHNPAPTPASTYSFTVFYDVEERDITGLAEHIKKVLPDAIKITPHTRITPPCLVLTFIIVNERVDVDKWEPILKERYSLSGGNHVLIQVHNAALRNTHLSSGRLNVCALEVLKTEFTTKYTPKATDCFSRIRELAARK